MFNNYLKIAIRNIQRQKLFSFINIFSLTVGLSVTLLLYLFVQDELRFDTFHADKEQLYRVIQVQNNVDGSIAYKGTSHSIPLGPEMQRDIPGIDDYARFFMHWNDQGFYIRSNNLTVRERLLYGDFRAFDLFTFPVISGTTKNASPYSVILSQSHARKFFGDQQAVGQTLSIRTEDEFIDFDVVAVIEDIPSYSSIRFDLLVNFEYLTQVGFMKEDIDNWGFGAITTFVKTNKEAKDDVIQENLDKLIAQHYPYYTEIASQRGYSSALAYRHLEIQPFGDIHFDHTITNGLQPSSNKLYAIILGAIALGILIIGCINFMNLSIARSSDRAKEMGVRMSIGAHQKQLTLQLIGESMLLSVIAMILAFFLVDTLLPTFNDMTGKSIMISALFTGPALLIVMGSACFAGIVAGVYPAMILTRFSVKDAFSSKIKIGSDHLGSRILVVFQFSLTVLLVVGMLVMSAQMRFIQSKDKGFDSHHIMVVNNVANEQFSMYAKLRNSLRGETSIRGISTSDQNFGDPHGLGGMGFEYRGKPMRVGILSVDDRFIETMGIELVQGRPFNPELESDYTHAVIVNEACFRDFELKLNEPFEEFASDPKDNPVVIGVMRDFHYSSLNSIVEPMLLSPSKSEKMGQIFINVNPDQLTTAMEKIETIWLENSNELPFEYTFMNDTLAAQYKSEKRWQQIIQSSVVIAILLSCFGLFGLVSLAIYYRRSEIGIRKILGAQMQQIIRMYSWKYVKLVVIAFALAAPVAHLVMQQWLETFAFRIEIGVGIYLLAAGLVVAIALLTISYRIFEAAFSNPIHAIRDE